MGIQHIWAFYRVTGRLYLKPSRIAGNAGWWCSKALSMACHWRNRASQCGFWHLSSLVLWPKITPSGHAGAVTTSFASLTLYATQRLFWQDKWKSLPKVGGNLRGLYLVAKMLVQLSPEYFSYHKKDFHPSEIDHSKILHYWKNRLANEYQVASFMEVAKTIH